MRTEEWEKVVAKQKLFEVTKTKTEIITSKTFVWAENNEQAEEYSNSMKQEWEVIRDPDYPIILNSKQVEEETDEDTEE